jgi:eukaryotic-like serine/threonine-protein kinase
MTPRIVANRYEIVRQIGAGGMGAVFLAKQLGVGNMVALKFLSTHLSADPTLRKRFAREAAMALEVTHPGAAQLLDSGDDNGQLFIVFEYVAGDDLSTVLDQQGALPFADAVEIALKVASVLAFAHGRGVVHRDIKPENIRLRRDLVGWHVKVLDFGIARLMDDVGTQLTQEGSVAGTPRYMAPEQISANAVDARTDIYSLGLVLFEMLTGREAFARESTPQLMWAQMHTPVPPLREVQPERDFSDLDAVIAMATAKQPEARFSTAAAFINALKSLDAPRWPAAVPTRRRRGMSGMSGSGGGADNLGSDSPTPLATPMTTPMAAPAPSLPQMTDVPLVQASRAPTQTAPTPLYAAPQSANPMQSGVRKTPFNKTLLIAGVAGAALLALVLLLALWVTVADNTEAARAPVPTGNAGGVTSPAGARAIAATATGSAAVTTPTAACPRDAAASSFSAEQLEARARALTHPMPSVVEASLQSLRSSASKAASADQDCRYRSALLAFINTEQAAVQASTTLWGHTRELPELKNWLRTLPLNGDWTEQQRNAALAHIDTAYIAPLGNLKPGDADYWRRGYIGLVLTCELTDAALRQLDARRPSAQECAVLS